MRLLVLSLIAILIAGCSSEARRKFRKVPSSESGIDFRNVLKESVEFNIFNYMYFYNGAGVGVGDFNNDGLLDVYFSSNQESNKLFLNQGKLKFKDVTEAAGVEGFDGWATGVSVVDINGDGRLDIYCGYIGKYLIYNGQNQLFINEGNDETGVPIFKDRAMEYGLDLIGFSTHAAFFDYDKDGDLDMYMLNHSLHQNGTFGKSTLRNATHPLAGDKLLKNDNGHFVDVTKEAGIYSSVIGYGLGVVVSDVNLDGWPDIYVGNDFHENDYLYINQKDDTFKDSLEGSMNHTSRYTMGVDFADFNNDAFPDLIAADMLPRDPEILKASQIEETYDLYTFKLNFGYGHQFSRNVLQINNKNGTFSDIALLAGVAATDWSWSSLFADFNLDGHKDILISNGIYRRSNDLDYINFITADTIQMKLNTELSDRELQYTYKMPQIKIPNALFINNHDSTFSDKASEWGLEQPSYSNGTAYADFDNDGDLDIVINNIEDEAFLYENLSSQSKKPEMHYLKFQLEGEKKNSFGIGTKIFVYSANEMQMMECSPMRGYMSSVDYRLNFGLGESKNIDSVIVVWQNDKKQNLGKLELDATYILKQSEATILFDYGSLHQDVIPIFIDASDQFDLFYKHRENDFVEFNREPLMPHMVSAEGPAVAIGDVNGDGKADLYLGGAKRQPAELYIQSSTGKFNKINQKQFENDSIYEDVDAVIFDCDLDGDNDILVVSGGNEWSGKSIYRQPRIYLNNGKGSFTLSGGIKDVFLSGQCVSLCDIDGDGDMDAFIGARATTWKYGVPPDSYILKNDGKGNFEDITDSFAPELRKFGMVKDAIWTDVNNDNLEDLIIACEWKPITIFENQGTKIQIQKDNGLDKLSGWWNTVQIEDIDNDGDNDIIAGNLGLNSKLRASSAEPVTMYVSDFDKNEQIDQIITYYINGKEYPFSTKDDMTKQMPYLKKKYLSYQAFSKANLNQIVGDENLDQAEKYFVNEFRSGIFRNNSNHFSFEPLPKAAQFSTVNAIATGDFNNDGLVDIVTAGNYFPITVQLGKNDASFGNLLLNNSKGAFTAIPSYQSGLKVLGEVRSIKSIMIEGKKYYLFVRNDDSIKIINVN